MAISGQIRRVSPNLLGRPNDIPTQPSHQSERDAFKGALKGKDKVSNLGAAPPDPLPKHGYPASTSPRQLNRPSSPPDHVAADASALTDAAGRDGDESRASQLQGHDTSTSAQVQPNAGAATPLTATGTLEADSKHPGTFVLHYKQGGQAKDYKIKIHPAGALPQHAEIATALAHLIEVTNCKHPGFKKVVFACDAEAKTVLNTEVTDNQGVTQKLNEAPKLADGEHDAAYWIRRLFDLLGIEEGARIEIQGS